MQILKNFKSDLPAGLVVFLVALPLCLGIALASGAPLFSGVIAGVVGGIVVGAISGSSLGISGPAAGLTVIVLTAIQSMGDFRLFLVAVVLAGVLQVILSVIGAGKIAFYFPTSVIKGMLAAIGVIIVLKQLPHAFGLDSDYEGDFSFDQKDGQNTFTELLRIFDFIHPSAFIIGLVSIGILLLWEQKWIKKNKVLSMIPAALICVIFGILSQTVFGHLLGVENVHLVSLPVAQNLNEWLGFLTFPDWGNGLKNPVVWQTAAVLAIVASLETLLCVEAADKIDPEKRITPTNRELLAQGVGNITSGLIGGIPLTQVVVRTSANLNSGGKTKLSAIFHGVLLLLCAVLIPNVLNTIPLACLAAVLILVGYKLAKPSLFKEVFKEGPDQFIPFIVTLVAIVATDLLKGVAVGLVVGLGVVIYTNFKSAISVAHDKKTTLIKFNKDVFFYNRAKLTSELAKINDGDSIVLDGTEVDFIDFDIFETIEDFVKTAKHKGIEVQVKGITRRKLNYRKNHAVISKTLTVK